MYKEYFGLSEYPFSLTPDPKFLVANASYNEMLAGLYYGIEMAKGLMVLTGEVGTGKTTALRWIIHRLQSGVLASYMFNPRLTADEFYHHLTSMLGVKQWANKSELLTRLGSLLEQRHNRGLRTILIVDEAHELSDEVLEEIRLLMNFESDNAKHLQIILTGQPELIERLRQPNLRQLKQRVALRCKMSVLQNPAEVERYIVTRLEMAGSPQPSIFTADAVDLVYQFSEGIPRQINNLCDNAMIAAYASDVKIIGRSIIEDVAENLDMLPDREALIAAERAVETIDTASFLTARGRDELLSRGAAEQKKIGGSRQNVLKISGGND